MAKRKKARKKSEMWVRGTVAILSNQCQNLGFNWTESMSADGKLRILLFKHSVNAPKEEYPSSWTTLSRDAAKEGPMEVNDIWDALWTKVTRVTRKGISLSAEVGRTRISSIPWRISQEDKDILSAEFSIFRKEVYVINWEAAHNGIILGNKSGYIGYAWFTLPEARELKLEPNTKRALEAVAKYIKTGKGV